MSPADNLPVRDRQEGGVSVYSPIEWPEIDKTLYILRKGALGHDGLTDAQIGRMQKERLLILFNGMLLLGHVPPALRIGRTVLISKTSVDLHLTGNWRPITISGTLLKLCNKIANQRLARRINLHHYQRWFLPMDGTFGNALTLDALIKDRTAGGGRKKAYSIVPLGGVSTVEQNGRISESSGDFN